MNHMALIFTRAFSVFLLLENKIVCDEAICLSVFASCLMINEIRASVNIIA